MGTNLNDLNSLLQLEMDQSIGRLIFISQQIYQSAHTVHFFFYILLNVSTESEKNNNFDVRIVLLSYPLKLAC